MQKYAFHKKVVGDQACTDSYLDMSHNALGTAFSCTVSKLDSCTQGESSCQVHLSIKVQRCHIGWWNHPSTTSLMRTSFMWARSQYTSSSCGHLGYLPEMHLVFYRPKYFPGLHSKYRNICQATVQKVFSSSHKLEDISHNGMHISQGVCIEQAVNIYNDSL